MKKHNAGDELYNSKRFDIVIKLKGSKYPDVFKGGNTIEETEEMARSFLPCNEEIVETVYIEEICTVHKIAKVIK